MGADFRQTMLVDFGQLRAIIGDEGASERFAKDMTEYLKTVVK